MPLPWKKSKSGRISRFVSDLQQSPKHGGSLVVETGFPTSLIDLFVKNRDRLKKSSSKRNKNNNNKTQTQTAPNYSHPTRQRVPSLPPPSIPLERRRSFPQKLDQASVTEDLPANKIEESFVDVGGLTAENRNGDDNHDEGGNHGGGGCVLMVVAIKVFVVAVLALSTKKLAVGVTLSAFSLLFLEIALARVFTLLKLCPDAQVRLNSLIRELIGKNRKEKREESLSTQERQNKGIIDTFQESRDCIEEIPVPEPEKKSNQEDSSTLDQAKPTAMLTIRDVVFTKEKSKSAKLKSKIVKKIVPKKLRSYKKKKKMKKEAEGVEVIELVEEEEEEEESMTELSSLYSEDRIESEISERDEIGSNPPLLESCEEIEEDGSKGDPTKAMALIVIALAGLLGGKVLAIGLTLSSCLILRFVRCRSRTSL